MQLIALEQLLVIYRLVPFKNEREIFKKKGETLTNGFVQVLTVAISFAFSLHNSTSGAFLSVALDHLFK